MTSSEMVPAEKNRGKLGDYMMMVPQLIKLVWALTRDPRVPARTKAVLFVSLGYVISPIDVIPDFIVGIGKVDDLLVAAFALDQILNRVPEEVVREHWDGDEDILDLLREVLDIASGFIPASIKKRLGGA